MIVPRLSQFICPAPASLVSNVPTLWLEDCLAGTMDYLVLVDANRSPVRVLPLHHLLSMVKTWASTTTPVQGVAAETAQSLTGDILNSALSELSPVEMVVVSVQLSPEVVAQQVAAAPDSDWVVINQQQQYLGLLDKTRLLATAFSQQWQASLHPEHPEYPEVIASTTLPASALESETYPVSQQTISQSNTALLTYLGHELKTPLTSLLGLSSLLKTGHIGTLNTRQVRYVSLIQQHCRRLAAWVNTLIDLGRIDSGSLRLIPHIVQLSSIWQAAYHQAALRVGQEEAPLLTLPPLLRRDAPALTLVADPPRLQQMLTCMMQTVIAAQSTDPNDTSTPPSNLPLLELEIWDNWLVFISRGLDEELCLEQLSQATFTLPFPTTSAASTPLSAEMGHWLEWLLVRKLAQLHGGELALIAHAHYGVCPTLLLPKTPALNPARDSRLLLFVASKQVEPIKAIQQQAAQLSYRLLITHQTKDAVEMASHIPLSAILIPIEGHQSISDLKYLKDNLHTPDSLVIALVPPQWSSLMGDLPADRELLWPAESLGSVLLQPPPSVPAPNRLTVLYLKTTVPETDQSFQTKMAVLKLPHIFHDFGCRVLEVDDLEQAALLRRVWKPDVMVLDPAIDDPTLYLQTLSRSPGLISLPLITLTMAATQAAHKLTSLTVFPCLVGETPWESPESSDRMAAWLIQVLQVAATHGEKG